MEPTTQTSVKKPNNGNIKSSSNKPESKKKSAGTIVVSILLGISVIGITYLVTDNLGKGESIASLTSSKSALEKERDDLNTKLNKQESELQAKIAEAEEKGLEVENLKANLEEVQATKDKLQGEVNWSRRKARQYKNKIAGYDQECLSPVFIIAYCDVSNFIALCDKYYENTKKRNYTGFEKSASEDDNIQSIVSSQTINFYKEVRYRGRKPIVIYHMMINLRFEG